MSNQDKHSAERSPCGQSARQAAAESATPEGLGARLMTAIRRGGRRLTRVTLVSTCLMLMMEVGGVATANGAMRVSAEVAGQLRTLQSRLEEGDYDEVGERAEREARQQRGEVRALYLSLAASARARQGDQAQAARLYAEARRLPGVDASQARKWLRREAMLRLRAGEQEAGTARLAEYLHGGSASADDLWLAVSLEANRGQWSRAEDWLERASRASAPEGDRLKLAVSVYQQTGRHAAAVALVEQGLGESRDAQDWQRAVALYQRLNQQRRAASTWEAAWAAGIVSGREAYQQRIDLQLAAGAPARAAELIEAGLSTSATPEGQPLLVDTPVLRRQLAEAWTSARDIEHSLTAWATVSEQSGRVEDARQLAELAYDWGRWDIASGALASAGERGDDSARHWLLSGVVARQLDQLDPAREAFKKAQARGAEGADDWLKSLAQR
ncbi:hypothetical protein V6243_09580 [Cobetia marina]|uniref:Tetratricopeptide repeat protein n=1 Tax=Cobetia marina TaxID=28258 RepID=A0ABU9GF41_COBMA